MYFHQNRHHHLGHQNHHQNRHWEYLAHHRHQNHHQDQEEEGPVFVFIHCHFVQELYYRLCISILQEAHYRFAKELNQQNNLQLRDAQVNLHSQKQ